MRSPRVRPPPAVLAVSRDRRWDRAQLSLVAVRSAGTIVAKRREVLAPVAPPCHEPSALEDEIAAGPVPRYLQRPSVACQHLLELSIEEGDKEEYAPLGELLPPKLMETLTERISRDPDVAMQFIQGLVERDEAHPDEDYVFQLPEEVKEEYRHFREKHKPS